MNESFRAKPDEVAGLSVLAHRIADDAWETTNFARAHTMPEGDFGEGAMMSLLTPLAKYSEALVRRYDANHENCRGIGVNLNRTAWMYHDQEARNYAALNANMVALDQLDASSYSDTVPAQGLAVDYENPARYVAPESIKLDEPETMAGDIRNLIAERAGWLGDVDEAIKAATNWSALEEVIKPVSGNWNDLKQIGEAHKTAGEAMANCGKNLEAGAKQVTDHWAGKAEEAFQDYARLQVEAMKWEGPVGRLAKEALCTAGTAIQDAAFEIVEQLADLLKEQVELDGVWDTVKFFAKKLGPVGMGIQGWAIVDIVMSVKGRVEELVERIRGIVDAIHGFLQPVIDMNNSANAISEETLGPIAEYVRDTKRQAEIGRDLAAVADFGGPLNRPTEDYSAGTGNEPWEDAA
ncbi:hypothetical protein [Rhodococcus gannanensis]|uniref:WXG100 family type VII secretion target n=1 Tax=Rhodococcus gannanensis TaxID=1960308 RepID=A0ABW4PB80_9NOCA